MNATAAVTAESSPAWSAREKHGAMAELSVKMKLFADAFQQRILY